MPAEINQGEIDDEKSRVYGIGFIDCVVPSWVQYTKQVRGERYIKQEHL